MNKKIEGIIPVMLTPYLLDNSIDYESLEKLIEWYIDKGADALFAVCQSSEMQYLTLQERSELAKFVVQKVNGRIPVIASGHISDDSYDQRRELITTIESGADATVLVTNHLDPHNRGTQTFQGNLQWLLEALPTDHPLGLYECPAPYRRLISDEEFRFIVDSGRFILLKDVSCDLETVTRRVQIAKDSEMAILNANAAIAWNAMKIGSKGFNGVSTNYHPDLYKWLYHNWKKYPEFAEELANFLALSACTESFGYPVLAKMYHHRLGNFKTIKSRTITYDVHERIWAIEAILDHLVQGTEFYRKRIASL